MKSLRARVAIWLLALVMALGLTPALSVYAGEADAESGTGISEPLGTEGTAPGDGAGSAGSGFGLGETSWNVGYTAPGSGVVATIYVAPDAPGNASKAMARSSQWSTDGETWSGDDLTLEPGGLYYLYTPLAGMISDTTAILPNIKAAVAVDIDPEITDVGDYFMQYYALNCNALVSLGAPDLSGVTTAGNNFMRAYAFGGTALTSLGIPDISGITTVGNYFLYDYARGCTSLATLGIPNTSGITTAGNFFMGEYAAGTSLTTLEAPDTSALTSVGTNFLQKYAQNSTRLVSLGAPDVSGLTTAGNNFLNNYADGCSALTSLGVPDISGLTSVGNYFLYNYALNCSSLTSLDVPDTSGITTAGTYFLSLYASSCGNLTSLGIPDTTGLTTAGSMFMIGYAVNCNRLNQFVMTSAPGWFGSHDVTWATPPAAAADEAGLVAVVPSGHLAHWRALTAEGKTLALNQITDPANVIVDGTTEPDPEPQPESGWNAHYTAPGSGVVATVVVADDATTVTKAMEKSSEASTDGVTWKTGIITFEAGTTYYIYTPLTGMASSSASVLPNIKSTVTVDIDPAITEVGNYFLQYYANSCSLIESLGVPDLSNITTAGTHFMSSYAHGCKALASLDAPDVPALQTAGNYFLYCYAYGCSGLPSLAAPDISSLTAIGTYFMHSYAYGCTALTSLDVPDTSGLTTVGTYFLAYYADGCSALLSLDAPDTAGITTAGANFMQAYAYECSSLTSLEAPDVSGLTTAENAFLQQYAYSCRSLETLDAPVTSNLTTVKGNFLYNYALACTGLTQLGIPDTSKITAAGSTFMGYYAYNCPSLTTLGLPDTTALTSASINFMQRYAATCTGLDSFTATSAPGWLATHDISWETPAAAAEDEEGLVVIVPYEYLADWRALTAEGKTLALNQITDPANVLPDEEPGPDYSWYNEEDDAFTLTSLLQFKAFANIVNNKPAASDAGAVTGTDPSIPADDFAGKTVTLAVDLDLGGVEVVAGGFGEDGTWTTPEWTGDEWTPIGYYSGSADSSNGLKGRPFKGVFDGGFHRISGLYVPYAGTSDDSAEGNAHALFGDLGQDGVVKNVVVVSGYIKGARFNGSIVGRNWGGVENCASSATVFGNGRGGAGGITGVNYDNGHDPYVLNCAFYGQAYNPKTATSGTPSAGGITSTNEGTITNSFNAGKVSCSTGNYGGITTGIQGNNNSYYLDTAKVAVAGKASSINDTAYAKTEAEMKVQSFVTLLGDAFNVDTDGVYGGFPILAGLGGTPPRPEYGEPGSGDLDGDGQVTMAEVTQLVQVIIGVGTLTDGQVLAADMDGDGVLTMADVVQVLHKLLGV
ncbi:MAG: dockerin type I domain-containing protein [Clostridiales Family XIII bacterium]|jgi:hypothetical protein|nr:dockerin type I domain-containing protein [Clostridiales Family XIII bacterium]